MANINKTHSVEIIVNGELIEIFSQDDLGLRFNNSFADPTKIETNSAEYSFSFTLPITEKNNRIFDFANVPSKRSKFNKRYPATVAVDGLLIFEGEILISSVTYEGYKCNLYVNRLKTVETVFGDSLMTDINGWEIEYDQDETINEYNSKEDIAYPQDCFFPLISYGMFQKGATSAATYTSKHTIDDYNRFYNETFYPSLNLLKTVEKCFNHKGYTVDGDIFDDEVIKHIFMSTNLKDDQDPAYNYGKADMGKLEFDWSFKSYSGTVGDDGSGVTATYVPFTVDDEQVVSLKTAQGDEQAIFDTVNIYDIWSQTSAFTTVSNATNKNLWRENMIVAPTSGYYKIKMTYDFKIPSSFVNKGGYTCYTYKRGSDGIEQIEEKPEPNFTDHWTELQLVRNNPDSMCGMITPYAVGGDASFQTHIIYGYHTNGTTNHGSATATTSMVGNSINVYPHEASNVSIAGSQISCYEPQTATSMLAFDPRVDEHFIMGQCASSLYYFPSVIKNGSSWDSACEKTNKARYNCDAYQGWYMISRFGGHSTSAGNSEGNHNTNYDTTSTVTYDTVDTAYNQNTLKNSSSYVNLNSTTSPTEVSGQIEAIVYLEKNDYLQLKLIQRQFENKAKEDLDESSDSTETNAYGFAGGSTGSYTSAADYLTDAPIEASGSILFEAYSPDNISIVDDSKFDWNAASRYNDKLDLSNFLNEEEKMSDFINNFIKEFNLSYSQNGTVITLNTQKIDMSGDKQAIYLTDRVSTNDYELSAIDYPSKMYVAYTINTEERGIYTSAEKNCTDEELQSNNWTDYADKGYDKVEMMDDEYASEESATTKTSYNWYEDFKLNYDGQSGATLTIPIQAKDEWMIDGYKDAEMMKKDGYSLKRRYWYPDKFAADEDGNKYYINLLQDTNRKTYLYLCKSIYNGCELSYKMPMISTQVTSYKRDIAKIQAEINTLTEAKQPYVDKINDIYKTCNIVDSGFPIYETLPTHSTEDYIWVIPKTTDSSGYYVCSFYYWDYYSKEWVLNDVKSTKVKYYPDSTKWCGSCSYKASQLTDANYHISEYNRQIRNKQDEIEAIKASIEEEEVSDSAKETLLTRYFNVFFDCDTNYLTFEAYLTTDEYVAIKDGANIVVDDDIYIVTELEGYDVSGANKTKVTAIKK